MIDCLFDNEGITNYLMALQEILKKGEIIFLKISNSISIKLKYLGLDAFS